MRKQLVFSSMLIVVLVFLAGCPMETKNRLDDGSYKVPSFLFGRWWELTASGNKKTGYDVRPDKKSSYRLNAFELDSSGKPGDRPLEIIMSRVGNNIYMTAFERGSDLNAEGYYILLFHKISDREFTLTGLKENVIDGESSRSAINDFLLRNKDNKDIYDDDGETRYVRE